MVHFSIRNLPSVSANHRPILAIYIYYACIRRKQCLIGQRVPPRCTAGSSGGLEALAKLPIGDRLAGQLQLVAGHGGDVCPDALTERAAGGRNWDAGREIDLRLARTALALCGLGRQANRGHRLAQLRAAGYQARSREPVTIPRGACKGFKCTYFLDPDGVTLELNERPPAIFPPDSDGPAQPNATRPGCFDQEAGHHG